MGFGRVFDKLTFKRYDCFKEKDSVCRRLFSKLLPLATCNLKQICDRIKLLKKFYLVCSAINERYDIE